MKAHDNCKWVNIAVVSETSKLKPRLRSKNSTPSLVLLALGLLCLVRDFGGRSSNASRHLECRYINRREGRCFEDLSIIHRSLQSFNPILCHPLPFVPVSGS